MNEIIIEMLTQLLQSDHGRLKAMLGTSKVVYSNDKNTVTFNFKMNRKANHCTLSYNCGNDLYDMEFWKISKPSKSNNYEGKFTEIEVFNSLYNDQLKDVFEEFTGLRLSL